MSLDLKHVLGADSPDIRRVLADFDPLLWATDTAQIWLPKSGPLTFERHPYLLGLYRDTSPNIVALKGAQLGACLSTDSDLLSRRGWLRYDEVQEGEDILTYDPDTETTRWSPVEKVWVFPHDGPMVHLEGRNIDALVTPTHRWWVKPGEFRETRALKDGDAVLLKVRHADFPAEPDEDVFMDVTQIRRTEVPYQGLVWCVTTRDGTFVMRRNGKVVVTGNSTWAILRSLWALTTWPMSVIYTSGVGITGYTQARINPIILSSPYLTDRILDIDSLQQKRFSLRGRSEYDPQSVIGRYQRQRTMTSEGSSTLYFTSGSNPKEAQARDADFLIHDEEDRSDPEVIEQYRSRISGPSPFKWIVRLSTPTVPGYGIDRAYRLTDMRHWLIKCPGCNERSEMAFPQSIEPQTWEEHLADHAPLASEGDACFDCYYICRLCKRRFNDAERGDGQWVPENTAPSLPHGYSVGQMAALYIPAASILKARFDTVWETSFHNLVMGVAHDEGTETFDRHTLIGSNIIGDTGRCDPLRPMEMSGSGCTMGVDVGAMLDIVISRTELGTPRTIRILSTPDWSELPRLMDAYHVSSCVIDARPEEVAVKQFQAQFNTPHSTRVYRAYYTGPTARDVVWNEAEATVSAPRSRVLSEMSSELLNTRLLPRYDGSPEWERFIDHMSASKRIPRFEKGLERAGVVEAYEWVNVGPDHLFHASVYDYLARNAPRAFMPPIIGLYSLNRSGSSRSKKGRY